MKIRPMKRKMKKRFINFAYPYSCADINDIVILSLIKLVQKKTKAQAETNGTIGANKIKIVKKNASCAS